MFLPYKNYRSSQILHAGPFKLCNVFPAKGLAIPQFLMFPLLVEIYLIEVCLLSSHPKQKCVKTSISRSLPLCNKLLIRCSMIALVPGSVYSWGMGTNMQLGTGEEDDEWSPVKITGKQLENRAVLMASSGGQHTVLLVKDNQESWSWCGRG